MQGLNQLRWLGQTEDASRGVAQPVREDADRFSSTDAYAQRFAGPVGAFFLRKQLDAVLELLAPWSTCRVLDVGGGHGQIAIPLVRRGFDVTVVGSHTECGERLKRALSHDTYQFCCGELLNLPFEDRSFKVVLAFRLLPHIRQLSAFIAELCRVAGDAVIVDYPVLLSVNMISRPLFALKKKIEGNTRPFRRFRRSAVLEEFSRHGFAHAAYRPQFVFPMALHRAIGSGTFSLKAEAWAHRCGLTHAFGSPVIARFTR